MVRRSPARFLAPLALIAAVVALVAIVSGSGGGGSSSDTPKKSSSTAQPRHPPGTKRTRARAAGPKTYRVQPGDTLGSISAKTGVPVSVLRARNPSANPAALSVGETLKLRP